MATPKIDNLSYGDLVKLEERLKSAISARKTEDAKVAKEELGPWLAKAGFDLDELFGKRGSRKGKGVAKYRNPKDPAQTWTGRGRKPNWLIDAVKKGGKIDSFAVSARATRSRCRIGRRETLAARLFLETLA